MSRKWTRGLGNLCLSLLVAGSIAAAAESHEPERNSPLSSPIEEPGSIRVPFSDDAAQFAYTSRFLFRRLFHPFSRPATYWTIGGILGASAVLEHNKFSVQSELLEATSEESNEISATAKRLGDAGMVPALGLLLFLQGTAFRQPRVHESGLMILESALYTGLFTTLGQFILSEERPERGGDLHFFKSGGHGVSGHAAIAASIAAPLSRGLFRIDPDDGRWARFGKRVGKGFSYGLPALTGLSRINDNKHYAWNVILGLSLGYAVGDTIADAHDARHEEGRSRWTPDSVGPLLSEDGAGVGLRWRF